MATSGASLPVDVAARTAAWDVALPDLSQRVLTQWCAPLANVRGTQNKATVLGILYAALHEQQQRRPGYDAFMAADPSAVREVALHLPDEPAFNAYIHLEAARRVLHELRQLQLRALGYREQPALFESVEELHARLQREEHQQALLRVVPPRARPVAPELAALFLPHVDVPMLLAALQRQEVLTPEGYWNGDWGKANDLMALVVAWQDGKYLQAMKWAPLMRAFTQHFRADIAESYARRRDKANPDTVQQFAELFPENGKVTRVRLRRPR